MLQMSAPSSSSTSMQKPLCLVVLDFDGTLTATPGQELVETDFYMDLFQDQLNKDGGGFDLFWPMLSDLELKVRLEQTLLPAPSTGPDSENDVPPRDPRRITETAVLFLRSLVELARQPDFRLQILILSMNLVEYIQALFRLEGLGDMIGLDCVQWMDGKKGAGLPFERYDQEDKAKMLSMWIKSFAHPIDHVFLFEDVRYNLDAMAHELSHFLKIRNESFLVDEPSFSWDRALCKIRYFVDRAYYARLKMATLKWVQWLQTTDHARVFTPTELEFISTRAIHGALAEPGNENKEEEEEGKKEKRLRRSSTLGK